jgi:4-amino-4-deoxy-L-arabinose transferase-like glycosyltransferase
VPSRLPRIAWAAAPVFIFTYLFRLDGVGLIGKDEPRYASIARDMASTGDWVTPRLWGVPWFEKPVLLYWFAGAGYRLGLASEWAPRLPVVLCSLLFLALFWWILNREFGCRTATMASLILPSTAAWVGYSQVAVPDLLLSTTFSAAMLLTLPWISRRETAWLPLASAMLALAVLAKGPLALALAAPLALRAKYFGDLLRPRVILPFLAVSVPWYLLCYLRNGSIFFEEFFIKHNWQRAVSPSLLHAQPWWYYLPVVAGLLLPWTPLVALFLRRNLLREPNVRFLAAWAVFGFVLLSVALNKLPGYLLPLFPAAAALMGVALDRAKSPGAWLAACGILLVIFPAIPPVAASAVTDGITHVDFPAFRWFWLLPLIPAAAAYWFDTKGRRVAAVFSISLGAAAGVVYLKARTIEDLDHMASSRALWLELRPLADSTCIGAIGDAWRFGLNYYSGTPLPDCSVEARPRRLIQIPGQRPSISLFHTAAR